jgi:hypothetical protein
MILQRHKAYNDFYKSTRNEPIVIYQGSKRSGKTHDVLSRFGEKFISEPHVKIQCFSESPKQQNFGLMADFEDIFFPILKKIKTNGTQKTFKYNRNELAFINISDNIKASDISNSLGKCDLRMVDECNMYSLSTIEKLRINNTGQIYLTYNPWREFWIKDLITDTNFLKTTWRDNQQFLTKSQIALFLEWTNEGLKSEVGSYAHWRWQVMCEGNYAKLTGKLFTTDNIRFCSNPGEGLHNFIIFADPSNARGGDYFALTLTAVGADGNMYMIDSFSCNRIEKVLIAEKIKEWKAKYPVVRTFIETNGEFGLKFYNDCVLSKISVDGWYSRQDKFERIMANFDVITGKTFFVDNPNNREFAQQIYTFRSPEKDDDDEFNKKEKLYDDNIDCLNNAIMAYILVFGELKVLF